MADFQHIVDEIRAYLAAPGQAGADELEPLAQDFARHCRETNERLRECQSYLRKGLRSEAIHLAEKHPALLDVHSALDFPELPDWRVACTSLGLTAPPQLSVEAAQALSDAYAEEMPLQTMLTAHQMLNLAQAPLEPRVRILRKIAAADSATLFWGDDLESLERLRLAEIESQAREAEKKQELGWLEGLVKEVRETNWRAPVPLEFKTKLDESLERLTNKTGEKMLRDLLPKLDTAHSAMNLAECTAVLAQWDHIVKVCRQRLPAGILDRAEAARTWVNEEKHKAASLKEFEEGCAKLQAGLDRDVPTVELENLFLATTRFPYDLPADLEQRYQQRLSARTSAARRRHHLTLAAIAAVVVAVLGVSGFLYYRSTYNSNVKQWVVAARDAADAVAQNGDLQRGQSVRESINKEGSRYLTNPDLVAEIARLDAAIKAERQRDAAFTGKLAQLQGANALDAATLKAAQALALRPDEKNALQVVQDVFAQARETKQRQADQQFMDAAAALRTRMDKELTADILQNDRPAYLRELATCDATLKDLESRPDLTESTRQSMTATLRAMLNQAGTTLSAADKDRLMIQAVADSQSSKQNQTALKDYLLSLSAGTKRDSFTASQMRAQGDTDVEAWDSLVTTWSAEFVPKSETLAATRTKDLEKYLADHPKSPFLPSVSNYRDFLKRGMDAVAEDGVWKRTLVRQMSGDLYSKLFVVETKKGKIYYTPDQPKFQVDSIGPSILAYLSPDLATVTKVNLAKDDSTVIQPPPTLVTPKSPQMIAAEKVRASVREMAFDQWPFIGITAFETFEASKCHPVVKASTLLRIAQLNQETLDWAGGEKLQPGIKELADLKLEDMHWINPDDQVSAVRLADVDTAVRKFPPTTDFRKSVETKIENMKLRLTTKFVGRGCFIGMPNETPGILTTVKPDDGLVAMAVSQQLPKSADDPVFVRVGHAEKGKWVVEQSIPDKLPEGTLLFIAPGK